MGEQVHITVPGKVILTGEHAVVYGVPAIAFPVARTLTLKANLAPGPVFTLDAPCWEVRVRGDELDTHTERLRNAVAMALKLAHISAPVAIQVTTDLPAAAGLGSSAALAVALARGLPLLTGEQLELPEVMRRAEAIEQLFHGTPSGLDHTAVAVEQPLLFRKGLGYDLLKLGRPLTFVVGTVGDHGATAGRVQALGERRRRHEALHQRLFDAIGAIAGEMVEALGNGDLTAVGSLMDLNHGLLNALGVSAPEVELLVAELRCAGALGAKMSGAGGGGAVLALAGSSTAPLVQTFNRLGYTAFVTQLVPDGQGMATVVAHESKGATTC